MINPNCIVCGHEFEDIREQYGDNHDLCLNCWSQGFPERPAAMPPEYWYAPEEAQYNPDDYCTPTPSWRELFTDDHDETTLDGAC